MGQRPTWHWPTATEAAHGFNGPQRPWWPMPRRDRCAHADGHNARRWCGDAAMEDSSLAPGHWGQRCEHHQCGCYPPGTTMGTRAYRGIDSVMRWQKNGWHDEVSRRRRSFNDRRLPLESPTVWRGLVEGETPANRGRDATRRVLTSRGAEQGTDSGENCDLGWLKAACRMRWVRGAPGCECAPTWQLDGGWKMAGPTVADELVRAMTTAVVVDFYWRSKTEGQRWGMRSYRGGGGWGSRTGSSWH
jgi:hypothetical protein